MPNRIIREGLLDSQRYWSVNMECRQFFVHLLLVADDFGCFPLAPIFIRRHCFDKPPSNKKIDSLVSQLKDVDLIRTYKVEDSLYGFIPRYGQRLQRMKLKYPPPPEALLTGDLQAQEKFNKFKVEEPFPTVAQQLAIGSLSSEVKRRELNGKELKGGGGVEGDKFMSVADWAIKLGLRRSIGEGEGAFQARISQAVADLKSAQSLLG